MEADHEIYPMPLFVRLSVADLEASTAFYRALGFDIVYEMPVMAHVRYRKYADLMLAAEQPNPGGDGETTRREGLSIYVTVEDESVEDVAERVAEYGAEIASGPRETPWNTREVAVVDPDGFEIVFAEQADPERTFEDVMGSVHSEV